MIVYRQLDSPLGALLLAADADGLCQLTFEGHRHPRPIQADWQPDERAFDVVAAELDEYFHGHRRVFDVPLSLHGTAFQQRVWRALVEVPWGQTTSYARLAAAIGQPGAYHAVGAAVGRNPVSIFVPCHRALGSDGSLTGYAGGMERKIKLLQYEGSLLV